MSGAREASLVLGVALALWFVPAGRAGAAVIYTYQAKPQPASSAFRQVSITRAPSGAPLTSAASQGTGENTAGVPSAGGDQLVENGLSSPLCEGSSGGELSSAAQSNCQTSGFVGAPAPTNDYELDVNINVGALGLSTGELLSVIQDVFIAPLWNALVWVVHALVVMLQWCYALELLGGSTMSGVASSLRDAQASFTQPWLVLVLAVASVLAFYNGLVRRRVSETLGQALLTLAMMAGGLWIIADPLGTVGAVGQWANRASLGTFGAVAQGTPADGSRALGDGMRAVFSAAIEMPWCYLEFGNVRWCSDPALLDSSLREAALNMVASDQEQLKCGLSSEELSCASLGSVSALMLEHSDQLVRAADTNGELFLAFAANGPQRNSVKEKGSLLHVLCRTENDTKCIGPTAAQAEFRSDSGTFPRMIGVVLIAAGVLGMVMLLGFIAVRLLAAAVASLFLLLLAPFVVLAPALGDGGRALFAGWTARLLGAVTSKLIYSFLLGVLLTMQRMLASLQTLGWWTDWLLIAAFWWGVFLKRHQVLAFVYNGGNRPAAQQRQSIVRRVGSALETPRAVVGAARWAKGKILSPAPGPGQLRKPAQATRQAARARAGEQVARTLDHDHGEASARVRATRQIQERLSAGRAQLQRVRRAREMALAGGDRRRAAKLGVRQQRIEADLARGQESLTGARRTVAEGERARRRTGSNNTREQLEQRARLLDVQAALPASFERRQGASRRRDYRALAGLAGYGREQYERLDPRARREARLRIDRELALRSQLPAAARDVAHAKAPALKQRERRGVDRELERALEQRVQASGSSQSRSPTEPSALDAHLAASARARERRSSVMDDAREVAQRRKRQLGYGPTR